MQKLQSTSPRSGPVRIFVCGVLRLDESVGQRFIEAKNVAVVVAEEDSQSRDSPHLTAASVAYDLVHLDSVSRWEDLLHDIR